MSDKENELELETVDVKLTTTSGVIEGIRRGELKGLSIPGSRPIPRPTRVEVEDLEIGADEVLLVAIGNGGMVTEETRYRLQELVQAVHECAGGPHVVVLEAESVNSLSGVPPTITVTKAKRAALFAGVRIVESGDPSVEAVLEKLARLRLELPGVYGYTEDELARRGRELVVAAARNAYALARRVVSMELLGREPPE